MPAAIGEHCKTPQHQNLIRFAEKDVDSLYVFEKWCIPYVHQLHFRKTYSKVTSISAKRIEERCHGLIVA